MGNALHDGHPARPRTVTEFDREHEQRILWHAARVEAHDREHPPPPSNRSGKAVKPAKADEVRRLAAEGVGEDEIAVRLRLAVGTVRELVRGG